MKEPAFKWDYQREDELELAVRNFGRNWTQIQRLCFPNLNPLQIKNKWYQLAHVGRISQQSPPRLGSERAISLPQQNEIDDLLKKLKELL